MLRGRQLLEPVDNENWLKFTTGPSFGQGMWLRMILLYIYIGLSKEINTPNFTPFPFCHLPGLPTGWTHPEARKHEVHSWTPCRSVFLSMKESKKGRELVCGSQRKPSRKCNVNSNCLLYVSTILSFIFAFGSVSEEYQRNLKYTPSRTNGGN